MFLKKFNKAIVGLLSLAVIAAPVSALAEGIPEKLVPMGELVGINMHTRGIIVAGLSDNGTDGSVSPARQAGITAGDVILSVNGKDVDTVEELSEALSSGGDKISVKIRRGDKEMQVTVEPRRAGADASMGVLVRDELTGIGTVTFYDPETGIFGALGHSVNDVETGNAIEFKDGSVAHARAENVNVGKPGAPGQLGGAFDIDDTIGVIIDSNDRGIYGILEEADEDGAIEIAEASEIKTGSAKILSTVSGDEVREYDVEIVRVYGGDDNRCMMIHVTDKDLIEATGGIVQGMSGSPIIQNGKLVGAVTHVLISDPTKGYGITIEKMLEAAGYEPLPAA